MLLIVVAYLVLSLEWLFYCNIAHISALLLAMRVISRKPPAASCLTNLCFVD